MTTRLTLAPGTAVVTDTPPPPPAAAAAKLMLESDFLSLAEVRTLANRIIAIRGVSGIIVGAELADDTLGDLGLRVFFEATVPDGLTCDDFDLETGVTLAPLPTITAGLTPSSAPAGDSLTLTWTSTAADDVHISPGVDLTPGLHPLATTSGTATIIAPDHNQQWRLTARGRGGLASAHVDFFAPTPTITDPPALAAAGTRESAGPLTNDYRLELGVRRAHTVNVAMDFPLAPDHDEQLTPTPSEAWQIFVVTARRGFGTATWTLTAIGPGGTTTIMGTFDGTLVSS